MASTHIAGSQTELFLLVTREEKEEKKEVTPDVMAKTKKNEGNDARFSGDATSSSNNRKMPEVGENALWKIYI